MQIGGQGGVTCFIACHNSHSCPQMKHEATEGKWQETWTVNGISDGMVSPENAPFLSVLGKWRTQHVSRKMEDAVCVIGKLCWRMMFVL